MPLDALSVEIRTMGCLYNYCTRGEPVEIFVSVVPSRNTLVHIARLSRLDSLDTSSNHLICYSILHSLERTCIGLSITFVQTHMWEPVMLLPEAGYKKQAACLYRSALDLVNAKIQNT